VKVIKLYDACCEKCGNWYGSTFQQPQVNNKEKAINEMKKNGWKVVNGKTLCHICS
jgi:hypothetical protein